MNTTYLDEKISTIKLNNVKELTFLNDTTGLFKILKFNFLYYPYAGKIVEIENFDFKINDITSLFLYNSKPRDVFCFANIIVVNNVNRIIEYPTMCYIITD